MKSIELKQGLNIAVDSLALLSPTSKNRGIGNYTFSQFEAILDSDSDDNYYFFNVLEELDKDFPFFQYPNFHEEFFYCGSQDFLFKNEKYEEIIGNIIRAFIRKYQIDVFYITSPFESLFFTYKKEWFDGIKVIATVYDIIPYMMREHYFKFVSKKWYMSRVEMLRFTDMIFVISQSVKDDMVRCLSFPKEKIHVIWGAAGKEYKEITVSQSRKEQLYSKFGISKDFIMCTGGDDERKNIDGLIEAYAGLSKNLKERFQLVIVCKLSPASVERYENLIYRLNCDGRVVLTNFVEFDELLALYNMAVLLAFPSKYEGFGLPIVEAWMCGTAVLTSNNSSLVQIAGDAAVLVDPYDIQDITRGLSFALSECDLQMLAKKGKERLKLFQWEKVAASVIEGINKLKVDRQRERQCIAVFTPLPPVRSGISDYSVDIINELSKYFSIDVFIDDQYQAECQFADGVSIYNHSSFERMHEKYQEIVYQIGNSEFHFYMYRYVHKYPGIVVLHDLNLNGAAMHYSFSVKENHKLYEQILREDFDRKQTAFYMKKVTDGTIYSEVYHSVVNGYIVNYAKKIIVHSNFAKESLLEKDIKRIVTMIPHYAVGSKQDMYDQARAELNISADKIVAGCFGFVHETKRAVPILNAFLKLCREYDNLLLYYIGKLTPDLEKEFNNILDNNQYLKKCVLVTGYTSLEDFNKYMDCIDIALNMRHPYNGENSGSAARLLQKGKCILVNNIGSFAEIPDSACVKLPAVNEMTPEQEIEQIYSHIKKLIESNERRNQYGLEARKYAEEELSLERVGRKYKNVIENNCTACIDERMIKDISQTMMNYPFWEKDLDKFAKTLAFSKKIDFD